MTVGIDHGRVLVSQLGMRGNRDIVALGASVIMASNLQDGASSGQTRISESVLALLDAPLAALFKEEGAAYVSTADAEVVGAKQESSAYSGKVAIAGNASTGARVVSSESGVRPARSWGTSE